jgi:Ni,Fe-hydrogenase III large subunit/Ni,Fe-hydrogenase III component G
MTSLDTVVVELQAARLGLPAAPARDGRVIRCDVAAPRLIAFAQLVCAKLGADLILALGEDRRAHDGALYVHYLFAHRTGHWLLNASVRVDAQAGAVPSLAPFLYPASRFEREMRDLFGIEFEGHPDPRPLVRHAFWPADYHPLLKDAPLAREFSDDGRPFPFTPVGGEGVYEIPVGPVHAGVIEPGHFRFSVMGETIIDMKSRLYFTHKGTEKHFEGRTPAEGLELAERISGDTSVGHALAYCEAIESAVHADVPRRARYIRSVLLELERLYNHVGDIGAIANDTGFAVAHAHCLRIRERLLRLNKSLTGSRLLRGVVVPGGVARDLPSQTSIQDEVDAALADLEDVAAICLRNTLLVDRLDSTGVLSRDAAEGYGVLGFVARASGIDIDTRRDHPFAAYDELGFQVPVMATGDVKARMLVRLEEARQSAWIVRQACRGLPDGSLLARLGSAPPMVPAFGIVEGWRGRIVHAVVTAADGRLYRVKIVDPSFFNWPALSRALMDNIVPDFPLCNKSFNQSYSGNDL